MKSFKEILDTYGECWESAELNGENFLILADSKLGVPIINHDMEGAYEDLCGALYHMMWEAPL